MVRLILLLVLLSWPAQADVFIRRDMGGPLEQRLATVATYRASQTRVVISGQCYSACTLYLGLPGVCVERSSEFGFHGPQSQYYGIALPPEEFEHWSRIMADHYPRPIRAWFLSEGRYVWPGVVVMTGSEVIRMGAKACR